MPISNFPNGFANGVNVRGLPLMNAYSGQLLWVDSNRGSNGNKGTFDRPFATIDYAVGKCNSDQGDIIMVKPGHIETVTAAGGLVLDVPGISIHGLGNQRSAPKIQFSTVVGADMDVNTYDITMSNIIFEGRIDALTGPIDVNAASFSLINCLSYDVTGQATDFIVTDANASRLYIDGHTHLGATAAGADTFISIVGGSDITIIPKTIVGNFAVAAIENVTTAVTRLQVLGSANHPAYIRTHNAADVIFTAVATTTGRVGPFINARLQDNAANITEAFVGAAMEFFQPINIVNADGESSMETNITASTDA